MYESFFHLNEPPFGATPNPRYLYRSAGHRDALAYLAYGVFGKKGFLALTGEVGIGKTTVVRAFVHTFHPCLDVAFVLNTKVTFDEMLYLILQDFGCEIEDTSKVAMLSKLNEYLLTQFTQNRNPVLIIDEAQNLSMDILEELRMLSNLETDSEKLVQIILAGQPELFDMLMRQELRQLRQRIPGVHSVHKLSAPEAEEYIEYRLRTAGLSNGNLRFTQAAHQSIYEYSDGIPRIINMVCDRALVRGYLRRTTTIRKDIVVDGIRELMGPARDEWKRGAAS